MTKLKSFAALETPHLILREIERNDADELAAFMTQPRYQKHIAHRLRDGAMVKDFVHRQIAARGDTRRHIYHLAAEEKLSGDVVGEGFIIAHANGGHELGWGVHPAMWSMGLGTEIGRALLALGFERLKAKRTWSKVMVANTASAKLAQRIGMALISTHDDYPTFAGHTEPVDIYGLTAADYFDLPY
jgi:[ribosomal protein S5]-alanine N-acetyltransferase